MAKGSKMQILGWAQQQIDFLSEGFHINVYVEMGLKIKTSLVFTSVVLSSKHGESDFR